MENEAIRMAVEALADKAEAIGKSIMANMDEGQYSRHVGVVEWVGLRDALAAYRAQVTKEGV